MKKKTILIQIMIFISIIIFIILFMPRGIIDHVDPERKKTGFSKTGFYC
jgi:ABC-type branched-subunit amino acid transport system permease subunit